MIAILAGNFSFITPGKSTLQIAIPKPTKNVPKKIKNTIEMDRKQMPKISMNNPRTNVISFDNLLANFGAIGDIIAKAINGKLVRKAILQFEKPISSRIIPINGPTDVIAGRKLNATKITPTNNRT